MRPRASSRRRSAHLIASQPPVPFLRRLVARFAALSLSPIPFRFGGGLLARVLPAFADPIPVWGGCRAVPGPADFGRSHSGRLGVIPFGRVTGR